MSFDLTANDLLILEKHRLERLRSFFADTLSFCFLHLGDRNTLVIHCMEAWTVDQLLTEMDQLRCYAWLVVGVAHVSVYFSQEKVFTAATQKQRKTSQRLRKFFNWAALSQRSSEGLDRKTGT
jgi:hypothetical protein